MAIDFVKMMKGFTPQTPPNPQPVLPKPTLQSFFPATNSVRDSYNPQPRPVQFGIPQAQATLPKPMLPQAQGQLVRPAPFIAPRPVEPKPVASAIDVIKRDENKIISQGEVARPRLGSLGGLLSGTGREERPSANFENKGFLGKITEEAKRSVREKGLVPGIGNLAFQEFGKKTSPTPNQYESMLTDRVNKLVEGGIGRERAEQVASQDIFRTTAVKGDLDLAGQKTVPQRDLGIELTAREKSLLRGTNITETVFAGLDAPIFLGTTKPVKVGLKTLLKPAKQAEESLARGGVSDIKQSTQTTPAKEAIAKGLTEDEFVKAGIRGENRFNVRQESDISVDAKGNTSFTRLGSNGKKENIGSLKDLTPDVRKEFIDAKNALNKVKGTGAENTKPAGARYRKAKEAVDKELFADELQTTSQLRTEYQAAKVKQPAVSSKSEPLLQPKVNNEFVSSANLTTEARKYKNTELNFVFNKTKASLPGDFAQDLEPAGRYMQVSKDTFRGGEGMTTGKVTFKNPLVVEFKSTGREGWKANLSKQYKGKTGKELSQAVIDDGYDGIITLRDYGKGLEPVEAVNLQTFRSAKNTPPVNQKLADFRAGKGSSQGGYLGNPFAKKAEKIAAEDRAVGRSNLEAMKKEATPPRIKIDAEIKSIRKAIKSKTLNAEKIDELSTRISIAEDSMPLVGKLKQIVGRNTDDTLSQIQATAMKQKANSVIAKDMNITDALRILKEPKAHNAKTLEAARIVRRANLDDVVKEEGFAGLDEAQEAMESLARTKDDIADMKASLKPARAEHALANKASKVASTVSAERRSYVKFLQDQFQLTDGEIKKLTFGRDLQRMGESEFNGFIRGMENRAVQMQSTKQAKWELAALLEDKHFSKVENYRKAQKLPTINNMTENQLRQYAKSLEGFAVGDEFLSPRTLETITRTELGGVKTMREVRVHLWDELRKNPEFKDIKLSDLENMKATTVDYMRYDTALAEKNPFYSLVVNRTQTEMMRGKASFLKIQEETNRLTKLSNSSRRRGVLGFLKNALIPKQKEIVRYLEAEPGAKKEAMEALTKEELDLAVHMEQYYRGALDHLIAIEELRGSRYADAYFTHTKKQFLEKWSDDSLIGAIRGVFEAQKDAAQVAKIIDQDTGQILSKSKFFKYTLRRTGEGEASNNATKVFLDYVQQMERKKMLDRVIPEIDVYTQALTPKGLTKKGLELDRSLKTFINKYLNNKKGRRENFGGALEQGGILDVALRLGNTFVSLKDLGGNIFASTATFVGEFVTTYQALGKFGIAKAVKRRLWDTGAMRLVNPNATKILKEAEPFLGRNIWTEIMEPNMALTDKALTGIFSPFSQSSVEMNKLFLLGKLTKEEIAAGKLSSQKMAQLRLEAGRWRDMGSEVKSIWGATSAGATANKYKGWAIPIARTNINNISKLLGRIKSGNFKGTLTSREFQETYRAIEMSAVIYFVGSKAMENVDQDTFLGKLYARIQLEAMTIMGGIDPTLFVNVPRLASFLVKLTDNLIELGSWSKYETDGKDFEEGDLKGLKALQRQLTPTGIKQFMNSTAKTPEQKLQAKKDEENKVERERVKPLFDQWEQLQIAGEVEESQSLKDNLSEADWEVFKSIRASWRSKHSSTMRLKLELDPVDAVKYVESLPPQEAQRVRDAMTEEEYAIYRTGKR